MLYTDSGNDMEGIQSINERLGPKVSAVKGEMVSSLPLWDVLDAVERVFTVVYSNPVPAGLLDAIKTCAIGNHEAGTAFDIDGDGKADWKPVDMDGDGIADDDMRDCPNVPVAVDQVLGLVLQGWQGAVASIERNLMAVYQSFDENGDGVLDLIEFENVVQSLLKSRGLPARNKRETINMYEKALMLSDSASDQGDDVITPQGFVKMSWMFGLNFGSRARRAVVGIEAPRQGSSFTSHVV